MTAELCRLAIWHPGVFIGGQSLCCPSNKPVPDGINVNAAVPHLRFGRGAYPRQELPQERLMGAPRVHLRVNQLVLHWLPS